MELCRRVCRHVHAELRTQEINQVQTQAPKTIAELTICTTTSKMWQGIWPSTSWDGITTRYWKRNIHTSKRYWKVFIVWTCNWHDYFAGFISNGLRTNKANKKNFRENPPFVGPYGNKPKHNSQFLRIRYDTKLALRCIIFVVRPREKQSRRIFIPREHTKRWQRNPTQW